MCGCDKRGLFVKVINPFKTNKLEIFFNFFVSLKYPPSYSYIQLLHHFRERTFRKAIDTVRKIVMWPIVRQP